MSSVWKNLRNRVTNGRSSAKQDGRTSVATQPKQTLADVATMATNNNKKQTKQTKSKKNAKNEDEEMREVLHLFNHLEELILEGDPRVREILEHKPLVQLALNEEGNFTDRSELSPRPYVPKLALGTARDTSFVREISGVSGRNQQDRKSTRPDFGIASPRKDYTLNKFRTENVIVQQPIPEDQTVSNVYTIPNTYGRVRRQPDGTIMTTNEYDEQPVNNLTVPPPKQALKASPSFLRKSLEKEATFPPQETKLNKELIVPENHTFVYDTNQGKSTVRVTMAGNDMAHDFNYTNPEAGYRVNVSLDNLAPIPADLPAKHEETATEVPKPMQVSRKMKAGWAEAASKVITETGGEITCYDCKVEVPKGAVTKALLRIVILDVHQVPYKSSKSAVEEGVPAYIPITPAIRIEPIGYKFAKPITVTLPTCIGTRKYQPGKKGRNILEKDLKTTDVTIKRRDINGVDWFDHKTEVFHNGSTVMFQINEAADLCALHDRKVVGDDPLTKRFAIYVFQSYEQRKKQFLSLLVCEDQPHVLQRGVESMPNWLHFTDSCVNVRLQEGEDLQVQIQPTDRSLCSIDANKMEIPWENLWKPECVIRKHFHVTMKKIGAEGKVKINVNDIDYNLMTSFVWQVQHKPIYLPEPIPVENYSLDRGDDLIKLDRVLRQGSNVYKHVNWKPPTPTPPIVTNESLLKLATM